MSKAARPEKLPSGSWRVRWLDADRKRRTKTFQKYYDAESFLRERQLEVERIRAGIQRRPAEPHGFAELCDYWLENRTAKKRSQKDDRSIIGKHLRPSFGHLDVSRIGVRAVHDFEKSRSGLSPKTLNNHLTLLISMLNLGVDLGWLTTPPRIKKPKLIDVDYRWLRTPDDIKALLVAARDEEPRVMQLYAAAVCTGMRAGELLGLRWEDVDLESRLITVRRSYDKPTKTGAIRHVPVLDPLLPVLREWRLMNPLPCVFPGQTGRPQGPSARVLQEILKRCLRRAELVPGGKQAEAPYERITFHDLRHTFASHWVWRGGDLFRLQKVLGHKNVQMTQRYAHLAPEVFQEDWGRLTDMVPSDGPGKVLTLEARE